MAEADSNQRWDAFLSHNSADKPFVQRLASRLTNAGIRVWLDMEALLPGRPWQEALEYGVARSRFCVACIGPSGLGPWQTEEIRQAEARAVEGEGIVLVPILLPGVEASDRGALPAPLKRRTWINFRSDDDDDAMVRLMDCLKGHEIGHPDHDAPPWATAAGEDEWGRWARLTVDDASVRLRRIHTGTFLMGSPAEEVGRSKNEGSPHRVRIAKPFWLAEVPVTQAFWRNTMSGNPSDFEGSDRPVESVSWNDAQDFLRRLNGRVQGLGARLPREAEWEYACRANSADPRYDTLSAIAWYLDNADGGTKPVGRLAPNAWGLRDMIGNVWEWCEDAYAPYAAEPPPRSLAASSSSQRTLRGGAWAYGDHDCRAARRTGQPPGHRSASIGVRIVVDGDRPQAKPNDDEN